MPRRPSLFALASSAVLLSAYGLCACTPQVSTESPDAGADAGVTGPAAPVAVRVGTWNLKDFPSSADAPTKFAAAITALDVDLLLVQEVADEAAFAQLVAALPGFEGALAPPQSVFPPIRVGALWRTDRLHVTNTAALFEGQGALFPRPAQQLDLEVMDAGTRFTVVNVHLKAGRQASDEQQRIDSAVALRDHLLGVVDAGEDEVLIMGDFNEAFGDPRAAELFSVFEADPYDLRLLSRAIADAGQVTFIPAGIVLDHLVSTPGLDEERAEHVPAALPDPAWEPTDGGAALSDHRPVRMQLDFAAQ